MAFEIGAYQWLSPKRLPSAARLERDGLRTSGPRYLKATAATAAPPLLTPSVGDVAPKAPVHEEAPRSPDFRWHDLPSQPGDDFILRYVPCAAPDPLGAGRKRKQSALAPKRTGAGAANSGPAASGTRLLCVTDLGNLPDLPITTHSTLLHGADVRDRTTAAGYELVFLAAR